ncbi:MAG: MerR family transcriptional regulator [Lactobacillus sp.]|jgi:DNA-binding transcriptional MerR regulator|nr:MerR family transcriptional regulator [Lactobacillus sp.]MCH3906345.1 MerR family transcriptional regulator [Lactobacillus sp.]MCH3990081.1 MerR family transcriptional regulator [Lactobacillus sp.]MCH4069205.1 MerR family transcriptional regulator [Lactobacillus sp.]MCI1303507.1 MerR family transcriptional regulator [Lactobacillus sp.]
MPAATQITEKTYSIGQVAKMFDLSIPTLRYYDQEGLIPHLQKTPAGIRRFTQDNIDAVRVIGCLKSAGMPIKEIQIFMQKVEQGDATLNDRLAMFLRLKKQVEQQMQALQNTMDMIDFKCRYYGQAVQDGTEKYVKKQMPLSSLVLPSNNK